MSQPIQMIIFLSLPFLTGLVLRLRGKHGSVAWMLSSLVIPGLLLVDLILPYRGGGASMWLIGIIIGSFYGTNLGGLGTAVASFYLKMRGTPNKAAGPDR